MIKNVDWLVNVRENREDNWEKNSSISFLSPPHIKQRIIRRWAVFWVFIGMKFSFDWKCSSEVRNCSIGMLTIDSPSRLTVGITKTNKIQNEMSERTKIYLQDLTESSSELYNLLISLENLMIDKHNHQLFEIWNYSMR